ncbi:MAG: ATP-dependent DNA ligase [Chloroflexi bacterium]|nr:ATP-dependent DNA ligase [Chloroflexota bacterium]
MIIRQVAEAFQALEGTTKRLEMSRILASLFRATPKEEVDKLIYILDGRLGPPYTALDFGVDEKFLIVALADAARASRSRVEEIYKKKGDLGLAAEELLRGAGRGLNFREAFEALSRVAEATGPRAHERKTAIISDLLQRSSGLEARYIVRILQGRLRLGVGDAMVMDALSEAVVGDRSVRADIERAYSICSDLGLIGRILFIDGPRALEQIRPQVGRPILSALAERLPTPQVVIDKMGPVQAEPKYDGLRLQLHKDGDNVRFFTRRLEDVTGMFPELAKAARQQLKSERAIVDGEALVYNPETGEYLPFQITVRRKRKYGIEEMELRYPLRYFAFDLLYVDDQDLTRKPLTQRRRQLEALVQRHVDDPIQVTEQITTGDPKALERYFVDQVALGLEGLVVKKPDSTYQAGQRSFNWVKLKRAYRAELRDTVDLAVVGYLVGKGKRAQFGIGSLLAAVYDPEHERFRTITKIGSGLTEVEWAEMRRMLDENRTPTRPPQVDSLIEPDVWSWPKYVLEVQADEITRSPRHTCGKTGDEPGYALRFPRVVTFRWDKRPEDATTEKEILEMYSMQTATEVEKPRRVAGGRKRAA